jgi:hypothetical protein
MRNEKKMMMKTYQSIETLKEKFVKYFEQKKIISNLIILCIIVK